MTETLAVAWDRVADDLGVIPLVTEHVRYAAGIKPLLTLPKSARIIEAGCGAGRLLRALAALGYERLVGQEISEERLEAVRRRGPAKAETVHNAGFPFKPESFDAAVSTAVIEHVTDPAAWLADLARIVRRDGIVSLVTDTYMWRWLQRMGLYRSTQPLDRAIWPGTLIRWARRAGLRLSGCGGFVNTPDQRRYFLKQLPRLSRQAWRLQRWVADKQPPPPVLPSDEAAAILAAVDNFPAHQRARLWSCIWSFECYYWFRKV
ncbi:MAG: class I SAM-dependent methyltransferase [Planctomycetes bacterium]|nr:class I SAM-dependent methyltransferase [Planctomycetota bacterium]